MFLFTSRKYTFGRIYTEGYELKKLTDDKKFDIFVSKWKDLSYRNLPMAYDILNDAAKEKNYIFLKCLIYGFDHFNETKEQTLSLIFNIMSSTDNLCEFIDIWMSFTGGQRDDLLYDADYNLYHLSIKSGKIFLPSYIYKLNKELCCKRNPSGDTSMDICVKYNNHMNRIILKNFLDYMIFKINSRSSVKLNDLLSKEYVKNIEHVLQYAIDEIMIKSADKRFKLINSIKKIRDKRVSLSFEIELKLIEKKFMFQVKCINGSKKNINENQYSIILNSIMEKYNQDLNTESDLLFKSQRSYIVDRTRANSDEQKNMLAETKNKLGEIIRSLKNISNQSIQDPIKKIDDLNKEISDMAKSDEIQCLEQAKKAERIALYGDIYCDAQILRIILLKNTDNDIRIVFPIYVDCFTVIEQLIDHIAKS